MTGGTFPISGNTHFRETHGKIDPERDGHLGESSNYIGWCSGRYLITPGPGNFVNSICDILQCRQKLCETMWLSHVLEILEIRGFFSFLFSMSYLYPLEIDIEHGFLLGWDTRTQTVDMWEARQSNLKEFASQLHSTGATGAMLRTKRRLWWLWVRNHLVNTGSWQTDV